MEYRLILRLLKGGNYTTLSDLQKKVDVLYMTRKLTDEEYEDLTMKIMLKGGE